MEGPFEETLNVTSSEIYTEDVCSTQKVNIFILSFKIYVKFLFHLFVFASSYWKSAYGNEGKADRNERDGSSSFK